MVLSNNKGILINGKLLFRKDQTEINLEVSGTCFPDKQAYTVFALVSAAQYSNEMYIDFGDDTGVHTYESIVYFNEILHYYQDLLNPLKIGTIDSSYNQRRKIKISFKYPNRVNRFWIQNMTLYGNFPYEIAYYNLTEGLQLNNTLQINAFPAVLKGLSTAIVDLSNITSEVVTVIPEWLWSSKIQFLTLGVGFEFGDLPTITKLDKLINIIGLTRLAIRGLNNNSVPDNFKNIGLKTLSTAFSFFTNLPQEISNITTIDNLTVCNSNALRNFSSWGNGIGLMTELSNLEYSYPSPTLSPLVPIGFANCWKIKSMRLVRGLETVARMNEHFDSLYTVVNSVGDKTTTVNNKFRGVAHNSFYSYLETKRPSGVYQAPVGLIIGSNNGTPASVMEKIYILVKQYKWVVTILNSAGTGSEILAP